MIKPGEMFKTSNGTEGFLIESCNGRAVVVVTSCPFANTEEDMRYYLGKQNWAPTTEVRKNNG
tara:strand:+ start:295 stop:483 length:189 start_codon:yes stop_codon:yes gene_type:complete